MSRNYRKQLKDAVSLMETRGWSIVPMLTVRYHPQRCCPMGALYLAEGREQGRSLPVLNSSVCREIGHSMGVPATSIEAFMAGFDGIAESKMNWRQGPSKDPWVGSFTKATREQAKRFYVMGKEFRSEYL